MTTVDITYRYETRDAPARPLPPDSYAALARLNDGNKTFAALLENLTEPGGSVQYIVPVDPRDLGLVLGGTEVPKQRPYAAILGCSDARVPLELIFNEGPNDLFVIRIAGNGLATDVLGSLKYAVEHLGTSLKVIAVLGHSGCGAVTAAVDVFLKPSDYLPLVTNHSLRTVLDALLVVVQASAKRLEATYGPEIVRRPNYRSALIEAAIVTNAALAAFSIEEELCSGDPAALQAMYGVYLLETREVWAPRAGQMTRGLAVAPRDAAEFTELGHAIAQSDRIASLLGATR